VVRALVSLSKFRFLPAERHSTIDLICHPPLRYAITVTRQHNMISSVFILWLLRWTRSLFKADPWSVVHEEDRTNSNRVRSLLEAGL